MRRKLRRGVLAAAVWVAAGPAAAQESPDLAARVKQAEQEARANAASLPDWHKRHSAAAGRLMIPVLNRCLPDPPGDIPTVFSVFVRLSQQGRAREIVTDLDAGLGKCMTGAADKVPFPEAPRDDFWIQLNMAAPL